jgi:hypothetical protein
VTRLFTFTQEGKLDLVDIKSARVREKTKSAGVPYEKVEGTFVLPDLYMNRSGACQNVLPELRHT